MSIRDVDAKTLVLSIYGRHLLRFGRMHLKYDLLREYKDLDLPTDGEDAMKTPSPLNTLRV